MVTTVSPYARLRVAIPRVRVDKKIYSLRYPYIKLRLGHRNRRTSPPYSDYLLRELADPTRFENDLGGGGEAKVSPGAVGTGARPVDRLEWFDFFVTLHEHLFWTLQIDLMDTRLLLSDLHVGRTELRLCKFQALEASPVLDPNRGVLGAVGAMGGGRQRGWYEIYPRTVNGALVELGIMPRPKDYARGAIEVLVEYVQWNESASVRDSRALASASRGHQKTWSVGKEELQAQVNAEMAVRRKSLGASKAPEIEVTRYLPEEAPTEEQTAVADLLTDVNAGANGSQGVLGTLSEVSVSSNPSISVIDSDQVRAIPALEEKEREEKEARGSPRGGPYEDKFEKDLLDDTRPMNDLFDRLTGLILDEQDVAAIRSIRAIMAGFGQGIEVSSYSLYLAFLLVQKYFTSLAR